MRAHLLFMAALLVTTPAIAGPEHKALAGHYYLQGLHEVGSELLLKDDGSFQWFMSYGAVDQASSGTWTVSKDGARLVPKPPEGGKVPVKLKEVADWSSYAEYRLRQKIAKEEADVLAQRCPSMRGETVVTAPAMSVGWQPDPTQAGKAADALKPLDGLREAAEAAAAASANKPDDEALRARSDAAVKAFWDQYMTAMNLHYEAGVTYPDIAAPQPPRTCRPALAEPDRDMPEAQWIGRQGVVVIDPKLDVGVPEVGIRMTFSDGSISEGRTDGRGFFTPVPQKSADVQHVMISYSLVDLAPVSVPIARAGRVLVILDFDYSAARPAFDEMILTRTPEGLTPEGYGRGVYVKGGK